ncbi:DUF3644 domain-containing protein [Alphaproteobacteria bacterium]|nr:DUF3644 domain-containing protein [Alphaproteobacteria bacterium]
MAEQNTKPNPLSDFEVKVIKKLLGENNLSKQKILGLINQYREPATNNINQGRITNIENGNIKKFQNIEPATDNDMDRFYRVIESYDSKTGLNLIIHERLVRSREAMILAVQLFNSPNVKFKTEVFAVLVNIAWTYLIQEYCIKNKIVIKDDSNHYKSLNALLNNASLPVSVNIKKNLEHIKRIRDEVEHKLFENSDQNWMSLFQACCMNFDRFLTTHFGHRTSLQSELSFALQFSSFDVGQLAEISKNNYPEFIESLDANLEDELTDAQKSDPEYKFKIVYTLSSSSKGDVHINFVSPESSEGKQIKNILTKSRIADEYYPHKPSVVWKKVENETGVPFNSHMHTLAWKKFNIRPPNNSDNRAKTNRKFCIYHKAHGDYTYSEAWVEKLKKIVTNPKEYQKLKNYKT